MLASETTETTLAGLLADLEARAAGLLAEYQAVFAEAATVRQALAALRAGPPPKLLQRHGQLTARVRRYFAEAAHSVTLRKLRAQLELEGWVGPLRPCRGLQVVAARAATEQGYVRVGRGRFARPPTTES